jgi:hypothetical protein
LEKKGKRKISLLPKIKETTIVISSHR